MDIVRGRAHGLLPDFFLTTLSRSSGGLHLLAVLGPLLRPAR